MPGRYTKSLLKTAGSADDGLLQRFGLAVWPDVAGEYIHVDQWPDTPAKTTAWAVFDRLSILQPASETDPVVWRFTPEAQEVFVEWLIPFETEIRGEALLPAMVSHLAKYRKLIPALALVFAQIDTPDSGNLIGVAELIRALAWGDYLRSHANRLYAAAVIPADFVTLRIFRKRLPHKRWWRLSLFIRSASASLRRGRGHGVVFELGKDLFFFGVLQNRVFRVAIGHTHPKFTLSVSTDFEPRPLHGF